MEYNRLYSKGLKNKNPKPQRGRRKRNAEGVSAVIGGSAGALRGTAGISSDPQKALIQGYHAGVREGIALCGVMNTFERWKVQRQLDEALIEAQVSPVNLLLAEAAGVVGAAALVPTVKPPAISAEKQTQLAEAAAARGRRMKIGG